MNEKINSLKRAFEKTRNDSIKYSIEAKNGYFDLQDIEDSKLRSKTINGFNFIASIIEDHFEFSPFPNEHHGSLKAFNKDVVNFQEQVKRDMASIHALIGVRSDPEDVPIPIHWILKTQRYLIDAIDGYVDYNEVPHGGVPIVRSSRKPELHMEISDQIKNHPMKLIFASWLTVGGLVAGAYEKFRIPSIKDKYETKLLLAGQDGPKSPTYTKVWDGDLQYNKEIVTEDSILNIKLLSKPLYDTSEKLRIGITSGGKNWEVRFLNIFETTFFLNGNDIFSIQILARPTHGYLENKDTFSEIRAVISKISFEK